MKSIKMDIPDSIPASAIDELYKQIKDLNEPQLKVEVLLPHGRSRTLYITYPDYFEDRDILITGTLVGAVLYTKSWKKK